MIRANLLLCICSAVIVMSLGDDELSEISFLCKENSPNNIFIDLSKLGIVNINKNFVANSGAVTCLNLAENAIKTIERGAFGSLSELKYLNLSMNPVLFDEFLFTSLPNLQMLVMDGQFYSDVQTVRPDDYGQDYNNPIVNSLPNLRRLSLRQHYGSFVLEWLLYLYTPKLTHLYLSRNDLDYFIESYQFASSIEYINLDYNRIVLSQSKLPNLRKFSMNHNRLPSLCNIEFMFSGMTLYGMPMLEELYLANNLISYIEDNTFRLMSVLRVLDLGFNLVENVQEYMFNNSVGMKVLKFNDNKLTRVFHTYGLYNLVELRLDGNKISSVDDNAFSNLRKLAVINLSRNGLKSVSVNAFNFLPSLKEVDLSWNNIKSLPANWMGFEPIIHTLRLDGNLFEDFASMSLKHLKKLRFLSIRNNPIEKITPCSISTLPWKKN